MHDMHCECTPVRLSERQRSRASTKSHSTHRCSRASNTMRRSSWAHLQYMTSKVTERRCTKRVLTSRMQCPDDERACCSIDRSILNVATRAQRSFERNLNKDNSNKHRRIATTKSIANHYLHVRAFESTTNVAERLRRIDSRLQSSSRPLIASESTTTTTSFLKNLLFCSFLSQNLTHYENRFFFFLMNDAESTRAIFDIESYVAAPVSQKRFTSLPAPPECTKRNNASF